MLKPVLLLTTLLFLIVAPEPDAKDIAEMSANFLVADHQAVLQAAETKQPSATDRKQSK